MKFGEKVQLLRRARGMTQEALAELLEVSRQSVAKREAGLALPDPDKLPRLSDSLRVTLDVLLRDEMEADALHEEHVCGQVFTSAEAGLYTGVLIKESLEDEDLLDVLHIHRVELWRTQGHPRYWTALTFSCSQIDLPQRLSSALKGATGASTPWFCDFRADNTKYVVFRGHVLHYRVGDAQGRADVVRACEAMGIPAHQTNWED